MKRNLFLFLLVLLIPCLGIAENVIEVLPTSAPLPELLLVKDDYAFHDLGPVFEDEYVYQTPAMTDSETSRYKDAVSRYASGDRPSSGILNLVDNVHVSVLPVPAELYEGESWFILLPGRELTDDELLQIVDAFEEMHEPFMPEMVTWHNCMRGGQAERLRSLTEEEWARLQSVRELFVRGGLRPEQEMTPIPGDDGLGTVTLDPEDYFGLPSYDLFPARRLTDDELLRWYAYTAEEPQATVEELVQYEGMLRRELHNLLGMSLLADREYENIQAASHTNVYGDERMCYSGWFVDAASGRSYSGLLDLKTGTLVHGEVLLEDYWIDGFFSDLQLDPFSDHVKEVALNTVTALRTAGANGIDRVEAWSASTMNSVHCAVTRIWSQDGGVYRTSYLYPTDEIVSVSFDDAESIEHEDNYYIHMKSEEEGIINE